MIISVMVTQLTQARPEFGIGAFVATADGMDRPASYYQSITEVVKVNFLFSIPHSPSDLV
jgi:hypothetical protein